METRNARIRILERSVKDAALRLSESIDKQMGEIKAAKKAYAKAVKDLDKFLKKEGLK